MRQFDFKQGLVALKPVQAVVAEHHQLVELWESLHDRVVSNNFRQSPFPWNSLDSEDHKFAQQTH